MNAEEYRAEQAAITAGLALYVQRFGKLFTGPKLSRADWIQLLQVLFPEVQKRYRDSAKLGRFFYDSQREIHFPELERNDRPLTDVKFKWYLENMEPARKAMSQADSPNAAVTRLALSAVREVEMAARRQIIGAVKEDPELDEFIEDEDLQDFIDSLNEPDPEPEIEPDLEPLRDEPAVAPVRRRRKSVKGWARVATGNETCAWCLMLISRGPTYFGADRAGLNLDDVTATQLFEEAGEDLDQFKQDTKQYVNEWHAGCDCLVIPVFDKADWPGLESQKRAESLWIEASKEATRLIESGEARTSDHNKETINALRRRIYRGEIDMSNYAIAA